MSLLETIIRPEQRAFQEGPLPLTAARVVEWLEGPPTATGIRVSPEGALGLSAVWACVDLVSRDVARTPVPLYKISGRNRNTADTLALYRLLHDAPNPYMTAYMFKQTLQGHKMLRGNAYANIERNQDSAIVALWPLRPDRMSAPKISAAGTLLYTYHMPNGEPTILTQSEVLHIRGLSPDGMVGYSPIAVHRETIGWALALRSYGVAFFGNNANPSGVLQTDARLSDEAAGRLKSSWEDAHRGLTNAHRVAVLEQGVKWQSIGVPPEDSQYLESTKFSRYEICASIYHVPPHKIGELDRATFSNIEEQQLDYEGSTLDAEYAMWEQQLNKDLILPSQQGGYYFEFNRNALVRATIEKRTTAYASGIDHGWITRNEVRERENLNPLPELDTPLQPLNMVPAGTEPVVAEPTPSDANKASSTVKQITRTADGYIIRETEVIDGQ